VIAFIRRRAARSYHFAIAVSKAKEAESNHVKYWEVIAANLSKAGWTRGCVVSMDSERREIFLLSHSGTENVYPDTRAIKLIAFYS